MQMLGSRTGGSAGFQNTAPQAPQQQAAPAAAPAGASADFDDDIPF